MPIQHPFDFKNPDYIFVFKNRIENLNRIRKNPKCLPKLIKFYKENPAQFIIDWGVTVDPRNIERGLPAVIPFLLFPKQEEWVNWTVDLWKSQKSGITEKSRDCGISWLMIALFSTLCLFNEGMKIGIGSRKEEYVDKIGDPKSLIQKVREFTIHIPPEFRPGWDIRKNAPHMRVIYPHMNSMISGESGDGIGRGDRTSLYGLDESAYLERPHLIEASLASTTNCRIDISTPKGMSNPFAQRRFSGSVPVFTFHWSDDPRKDEDWYKKTCEKLIDPVIIAQEIDLSYSASIENIVIPSEWVKTAIDAHIKLNIDAKGIRKLGFDVADGGADLNAECGRYGILIEHSAYWSGKESDIYASVEKVIKDCDILDYDQVIYDADGLGAGIKGDARVINKERLAKKMKQIKFIGFKGSGAVIDPERDAFQMPGEERDPGKGRTNEDLFANAKAQGWWDLRIRFLKTYRMIKGIGSYNKDDLISISSKIPNMNKLVIELSQPTFTLNNAGKIIIEKTPAGTKSPNLADSAMVVFSREKISMGLFAPFKRQTTSVQLRNF